MGFLRSSTVRETGEYAMRGGIVDLFPPGMPLPIRLDFFGDTLETIRPFDPETQRSTGQLRSLDLVPMSEVQLNDRRSGCFVSPMSRPSVADDARTIRSMKRISAGRAIPAWSTGCRCSTTASTPVRLCFRRADPDGCARRGRGAERLAQAKD